MSEHSVKLLFEYDTYPTTEFVCSAPPEAFCHSVWDCDCETIRDYSVVHGVPAHEFWNADTDEYETHWGKFGSDCSIKDYFGSWATLNGEIAVEVEPEWLGEGYDYPIIASQAGDAA